MLLEKSKARGWPAFVDPPKSLVAQMLNMTPEEAVAFMKEKGFEFTWGWREQLKINHAEVFTVAKAMRMDILQDIRGMINRALADGMGFREFQKELKPLLQKKGWWGKKLVDGPQGSNIVQLGSPHRLRTIYETNLQSSYMAGRWKAQEENKDDRPYLQYIAILDSKTRPSHRALNGVIKKVDDPFWNSFYPPNGYSCRCRTRELTEEQYRKATKKQTPDVKPDEGFDSNPGKDKWEPKKKDYDNDIWETSTKGEK